MLKFETTQDCTEYVVRQKYLKLSQDFLNICRAHRDLTYDQIPEAKVALKEIEEFERFSEKYFGIKLDNQERLL